MKDVYKRQLLDTAIMLVLGNLLAAQGAALMDELMQGVLSVVACLLYTSRCV